MHYVINKSVLFLFDVAIWLVTGQDLQHIKWQAVRYFFLLFINNNLITTQTKQTKNG